MTILTWLGAGIGVLIGLGTIVTFLRSSADKGTIASLERSNAALTAELGLTNTRCDTLDTRVRALENENQVLRAAVSHTQEIQQLQTDVNELLALVRTLAA
jgi:hypothetical protein